MKADELKVGTLVSVQAHTRIRYEVRYSGPWTGCGGDMNIEADTQFSLLSRRDGGWFCRCQDERIVKRALELEKTHISEKPNADLLRSRLLGISGFEIQDKCIQV